MYGILATENLKTPTQKFLLLIEIKLKVRKQTTKLLSFVAASFFTLSTISALARKNCRAARLKHWNIF